MAIVILFSFIRHQIITIFLKILSKIKMALFQIIISSIFSQKCKKQKSLIRNMIFLSIIIIMYFRDSLSYYLTINPSQVYFCSLSPPTQQVLSKMKTSSLVTMQIDRLLYYVQIQPDNVQQRLSLMMLTFSSFIKKMATRLESEAIRQKRFRIFFSFENQEIQKDQFRNMLDFFKVIKLGLMQHDKRKQLLLNLNANEQSYQQFLQSLNKEVPIFKLIQKNQLIQQYVKKNKLQGCRSYGLYAHKINQDTFLAFTDRSKIRLRIIKANQLFKIARFVNFAVQENYKIEIAIQIGATVDCYLDIHINTGSNIYQINKIKEIVKLIQSEKIHELYPIVQITSKSNVQNIKTFNIEAKTFEDIYQFMKFSYYSNTPTSPITQQKYLKDIECLRFSAIIHYPKEKYQQFSMKEISWLTEEYPRKNLLFLKPYWDSGLLDFLDKFYMNWEDYILHWNEMSKFIRLLDYKSYQIQEKYKNIYPKSLEIIQKFMNKFGQKTITNIIKQKTQKDQQPKQVIQNKVLNKMMHYLKIQDHVIDQIIRYLIRVQHPDKKDQKFKLSISNELLKGKPVNFSNLIAVIEQFQDETSKWQDVLHLVFKEIYKITIVSKTIPNPCIKEPIIQSNQEKNKKYMNQEAYLNKIQNEKLIKVNCLGCSQHFLYNMNIKDNSVNKNNLIVFQKAEHVQLSPLQVKLSICGLINSIEGGIILFGCQKKYLDIHTQGSVISQSMKREFIQIIQTFRQSFYPRLKEDNLIVNFVPIIANPYLIDPFQDRWLDYEGTMKELKSAKYVRRKYYEGTYVMRIIVRPVKQGIIHYFEHDQNEAKIGSRNIRSNSQKRYKLAIFEDSKIVEIPISQLRKTIKKSYANHIDSQLSIQTINILKIPSLSNHRCLKPDQGLKVTVKYDDVPQDTANKWQQKFKCITQVIAKRKYLLIMRDCLKQMRYDCQVQRKFLQYDLQSARNTAIIYHDIDFSQLKYIIKNNHSFARIAGEIQIFPIKSCVKVWRNGGKALSSDDERKLKKWFNTEFPSSLLTSSETTVEKERPVVYFRGNNKIETFFIYLILKNFSENAVMEDDSSKIMWKKPTRRESQILFVQVNNLCIQAQFIQDFLIEITKHHSSVNINKPKQQKWIRNLCFALINQDTLSTWQRTLERGPRKELIIKFIQKMAESKQCVIYLGERITNLWKMIQYEYKDDINLEIIESFCSLQEENQNHQSINSQIKHLQIVEEIQQMQKIQSENEELLMSLIEQSSRRHSQLLQRMFQQQIPEFCIDQIAEQQISKQFSKIIFDVKSIEQFLNTREELQSIISSIEHEIDIDYKNVKYGYSKIILLKLLIWANYFQQFEDYEIIKLFERLLFQDKILSSSLLELLQDHAEKLSASLQVDRSTQDMEAFKRIDLLLSSSLFASCSGDKLDKTQYVIKMRINDFIFMQDWDFMAKKVEINRYSLCIQQYMQQQLKEMYKCVMIKEKIQNWIRLLRNKQYGWMMANSHYVSQLLSRVNKRDELFKKHIDQIIKQLADFADFLTKEITKISFKNIQEYFWLFNLMKNNWLYQEFKQINSFLEQKFNNFELQLQRNLLRTIDEFLLQNQQKNRSKNIYKQLKAFVCILEKARQLFPKQKFTQFSDYKKEQVIKILRSKINWQAYEGFYFSQQKRNQMFPLLIDVLQNIEFRHYIKDYLIMDIEQIKQRYQSTPRQDKYEKHQLKRQAQLKKVYQYQDIQIVVTITKGFYQQNQIVVYSNVIKNDKTHYSTFARLKGEDIEQFLFQLQLESLLDIIPKKKNGDPEDKQSSSSLRQGMEQSTKKWLLQRLKKNNNIRSQQSTQNSQIITSQEKISTLESFTQSNAKNMSSLQDQIIKCQHQIVLQLFDLYADQFDKVIANIECNKYLGKDTFEKYYNYFQLMKKYRSFMMIISQEYFVQMAAKEIQFIKQRNNYFQQEDFIGLDAVQTYKNILVFMEENRQLSNSLNKWISTANTFDEPLKQDHMIKFQKLYELMTKKQKTISNNTHETINLLLQTQQILQKLQGNYRKEPIIIKLQQKSDKIIKNIKRSVEGFFLNVEDPNQIQNQLLNYINNLGFTCMINVQKGIDQKYIRKTITKFKDIIKEINEKAKEELQRIFYIGSQEKYFNILIILIDIIKKSKTIDRIIREQCDLIEKNFFKDILKSIKKQMHSNDQKIADLRKRMRFIKGAEAYYLSNIESDIKDLEISITKIAKLNKMLPKTIHLGDFDETKFFSTISQWKAILLENHQETSDSSKFQKDIEKTPRTYFDLLQLAFNNTIKTFNQQFRESQRYPQDIFFQKLLKDNTRYITHLQRKMQLLGKIIAIFDITHQYRTFRSHFKYEMTLQTAKIAQKLRHMLCEIAQKIQQKLDTSKFFVINCSLQDRVIAVGIISIYLAITAYKQVSIACSPFFSNKCHQLFQKILKNCNLHNKVKIYTYKQALIDALTPIIKTTNEEMSNLFNFKNKDMENIMIEKKGDQQIIFPEINKKILMLDEPSDFFEFLSKQNVFVQTMTLSDPILQNFLKIIKKTVSSNEQKFLTKILMQNTTKTFFKQHPIFDKILIQQTKKMVRDVKDYKCSYQIVKGKLIHEDCNGRLNEDLKYGYKTIFSILEEFQADKIASVHKKNAVQIEIVLNLLDLLALDVYFEKIYGFVEYENSLCTPTSYYLMSLYKIQKERIIQLSKEQNNGQKRRKLLTQIIKQQQKKLDRIIDLVQQSSKQNIIIILKDKKQIQELTKLQNFAKLSKQSWIIKNLTDIEWPFYQQTQNSQKNIIVTTQEYFIFILKDMLIYQLEKQQANNTIVFCSFKPKQLYCYQHIQHYINKIVFIEAEDILDQQLYRNLQDQKCLESLKNRKHQTFQQKSISRYRFVNNILALNMIQSRLLPNLNIIIGISANSQSLRLFDFRLLIRTLYRSANTTQFNLFMKIVVFKGAQGKCRYVETPFNDDPNPLLCFLKDFKPGGSFDPADTYDMLRIVQTYQDSRYFVFVDNIQKTVQKNQQKVKLLQMPFKRYDLRKGQTIYDLYKKNQDFITDQILSEIQIIGRIAKSDPSIL